MRKPVFDRHRCIGTVLEQFVAVLAAFGAISLLLCVFAFLTVHIDASDNVFSGMSAAALFVGAYIGGYVCGRRRKHSGLLMGALTGLLVFIIVLILGSIFLGAADGLSHSGKLFLTVAMSAAGGAVGVNHQKKV